MSKFLSRYSLLFIGILLDLIVSSFLPVHFGYQSFVLAPYFSIAALMLVIRNFSLEKKLLVSGLFGIYVEMGHYNTNMILLTTILMIALLCHIIWPILGNSMLEKGILVFFLISSLLFSRYILATLFKMTDISLVSFITYEFILTMLLNIVVIAIIVLIDSLLFDFRNQKDQIKRRREHISLIK